jgi:hypothetical protein
VGADGGRGAAGARRGEVEAVLARGIMLLPSVVEGCGPFPDARHGWSLPEEEIGAGERAGRGIVLSRDDDGGPASA